MKKYAISAVPGRELDTYGITEWPYDGFPDIQDTETGERHTVAFTGYYPTEEAAYDAAQSHYYYVLGVAL